MMVRKKQAQFGSIPAINFEEYEKLQQTHKGDMHWNLTKKDME